MSFDVSKSPAARGLLSRLTGVSDRLWRAGALAQLAELIEDALPVDRRLGAARSPMLRLRQNVAAACDLIVELRHRSPRRHPLTGVETRELLFERMESRMGAGLLGVIELTDFDALSAQDIDVADKLLKAFAMRAVRMTGTGRLIAQIDRARFAIWFDGGDPAQSAREFEAQCYALRGRIEGFGPDLIPQIMVGSITVEAEGPPAPVLLARAIATLSHSPRATSAAGAGEAEEARERFALEQDLRQAVARHQFELHYQPFVDAEQGSVCGAEALLRWQHPDRGAIAPSVFVPLMEKAGLAEEVGLWVLDSAICAAATWQRQGLADLKVAVNLSAHQLDRPDLDTVIDRMLARHDLASVLLELELTESVAAVDSAAASALFDRMRARKISISIDDFGTGYSSLSYLKKLSFDKLKIDREFVTDVDSDRQSQAICQSVIALARGLGITVLAEGVERHEEYAWLRRHGCRFFQGYYFSPPLRQPAFLEFACNRQAVLDKTDLGPGAMLKKVGVLVA